MFDSDATVEIESPETRIYKAGDSKVFNLEAGEQVDHYIAFPEGVATSYDVYSTDDSDYVKVFRDGRVIPKGTSTEESNAIFKFRALTKSKIKIVVF